VTGTNKEWLVVQKQCQAILGDELIRIRDPSAARSFDPYLLSYDDWLAKNKERIALG
jgi:hypothetical protein